MRRFFVEEMDERSTEVELTGDEFYHLNKVLRLDRGASVRLFNGRGLELTGVIDTLGKSSAVVVIEGLADSVKESPLSLVLLQALIKGDKPDFIVQKATELGVKEVCFYQTPRTVARVEAERAGTRLHRWKKVSIEAAKQCGRSVLPEIRLAPDLKVALESCSDGLRLQLWEKTGAAGLKDTLAAANGALKVAVLVGPEGGLSNEEAREAETKGFRKVGLGPRILRAETAAVAVLSIVQHALGDLN